MESMDGLGLDQNKEGILALQCMHSEAAFYFGGNWDTHWTVGDIEDTDESYKVECNPDIHLQQLRDDTLFLAACQKDGVISLLFTVSPKQKYPFCSKCSSKKCACFRRFKKALEEQADPDESMDYYWKRLKTERPQPCEHFLEIPSTDDHFMRHGYNLTTFEYPIKRDRNLQEKFIERFHGKFNIPEKITPIFDISIVCEHGSTFDPSDQNLKKISPNIKVFTETAEFIVETETFGRPSAGNCKCVMQADTHDFLLWNLGNGKFICLTFLLSAIHKMTKGMAMNAMVSSRAATLSSLGIQTSLTVKDLDRSLTGFAKLMSFRKEDFLCDKCGETPQYIVCDGKAVGPTKRKIKHLAEFDRAVDDQSPLPEGSSFKDRVFLSSKQERDLVKNLLTEEISTEEFLESDFSTDNGDLVHDLVTRLSQSWPDDLPAPYRRFLCSIAKYTSVAGYLQVLSNTPLVYLADFCQELLDLRSSANRDKLQNVMHELPALWPNLLDILNMEKSNFLPPDVSRIVLCLVTIRTETFQNAAPRHDDEYIPWPNMGEEHPTQFYPNWNIFRYPKKYDVRRVTDSDFCDKVSVILHGLGLVQVHTNSLFFY